MSQTDRIRAIIGHYLDLSDQRSAQMMRLIEAEIAAPADHVVGGVPVVSVKKMQLSDGRADYFVSIKVGNREVTPHVFREEYKAAYHVDLYSWLLNGAAKPDLMAFDEGEWPAQATDIVDRKYQERVAAAHHALFHDDPTDIAERLARYAEETNEVLQAFGMSREDMHRLVDYTCDRPAGEPAKEIGAALLTLTSLCVVAGYDVMACGEADLEKLQQPETIARIRAKRATRHGRGPLPGFDPSASAEVER